MSSWYRTMDDGLWLQPDETGEDAALFLINVLRLSRGDAVLDAPCGAGRVSVHLARLGCIVTGYDLRASFVERARDRFRQQGIEGSFLVGDLREMEFNDEFDAAVNWAGSFGYFNDEDNLDVTRRYARALRTGGRFLNDQPNRERVLRNFVDEAEFPRFATRTRWDKPMQRVITQRIVDGVHDPRNDSSMRLYTPAQMHELMADAGLEVEAMYGSLAGDAWTRSSRRMITVARKR